jgi:predicted GTPase
MTLENIHIAILGPVSAGKSTFLNALFSNTFSDMKRKKTTMLPQIYHTTKNYKIIDTQDEIYEKNRISNEHILKLREENKYSQSDFTELKYNVECIDDFINLPDKTATYSILDMPGLNCGGGDNMYFNYISQISKDIDIYLLVFDINSGLNTTDEVNILTVIANEIKKNKYGYVHIIINKCDDVVYKSNSFKFNDDELQELYDRCVDTTNKYFKDIKDICEVSISPLCASDLYVFRSIKNNIDSIDEKHLDKIIMNECGKKELNKLNSLSNKQKYIQGLIKQKQSTLYDDWMKDTGYNMFKNDLNNITSNYKKMIQHHIIMELTNINSTTITDLDYITGKLVIINDRLSKLTNIDKKYKKTDLDETIDDLINKITGKINTYINEGMNSYSGSTIEQADSFINKISSFAEKIKNWFIGSNPLDESKYKLIDKRYLLLNDQLLQKYDEKIFGELYNISKVDLNKFKTSINNSLIVTNDEPCLSQIIIRLLKSIYSITNNKKCQYISTALDMYFSSEIQIRFQCIRIDNNELEKIYKTGLEYSQYYKYTEELFTVIANVTDDKLNYIIKLLESYITNDLSQNAMNAYYHVYNLSIYQYWHKTHFHLFNQISEINYIYYRFSCKLNSNYPIYDTNRTLEGFNNISKRMDNVFNILVDIYSNNLANPISRPKSKLVEDHFLSADEENNSDSISESTEDYSDNDDDKTVYDKASRNASVRLKKTIKLGTK